MTDKTVATSERQMMFYNAVVPLSGEAHRNMVFYPDARQEFAADTHFVPLSVSEFVSACHDYPIVFVEEGEGDKKTTFAIALLGLTTGHNSWVDGDRRWQAGAYIPAFVRRYPFVPATSSQEAESLTVCIDDTAPHFKGPEDAAGVSAKALFDTQGEPSRFLQEMISFLQNYQADMHRTANFVSLLREHDLLIARNGEIRDNSGGSFTVADMLVVDEEKLVNLPGSTLSEFAKTGALAWIYAHLVSLDNLKKLFEKHKKQTTPAA